MYQRQSPLHVRGLSIQTIFMKEVYQKRAQVFEAQYQNIKKKHQIVGGLRIAAFVLMILFFYFFMRYESYPYLYVAFAGLVLFVGLLRWHLQIAARRNHQKVLWELNQREYDFLDHDRYSYPDGKIFEIPNHPYSYDLDILGPRSLYQHLNRTETHLGGLHLAAALHTPKEVEALAKEQEAVQEMVGHLDWRQEFQALTRQAHSDAKTDAYLKKWATEKGVPLSKGSRFLSYLLPALLLTSGVAYGVTDALLWSYAVGTFFVLNLMLTSLQMKRITQEIQGGDKIHESITAYAHILNWIETANFSSARHQEIKAVLHQNSFQASKTFLKLGKHFEKLHTVANIFVNILFNGLGQYHVHVLHGLLCWKERYATSFYQAIAVVADVEVLHTLANFTYNNSHYVFPELKAQAPLYFKDLGHPMLQADKRVCNDVDFREQRFVILTGSNMSGKSTFLRTIGVNMVLAGMGAPVCATAAVYHPMPLWVSMRLTDSLEDSESYFYAEVKRLQALVTHAETESCMVLLDEILRGTNSDDKQQGTIGVLHKLLRFETYGMIATHDLEVCEVAHEQPDTVQNKCFEVLFAGDELQFDYKLRDGICQNKNATFIMKKMNIID